MWQMLMFSLARVLVGLLFAGLVLAVAIPLVPAGLPEWSAWAVTVLSVLLVFGATRGRRGSRRDEK